MFLPQRFFNDASASAKPPVAISSCLTGERVRYDGDHKQLPQWQQVLAPQLQWLPVCPEVGAGLGVPRPPVRLVVAAGQPPRALGRDDPGLDVTDALAGFAVRSAAELRERGVCGYLWQSRSPSCGRGSTPLFDAAGRQIGLGSGIQAASIARALPWLAVAEDTEVATPAAAWRFVLRCRLVHDLTRARADALPALHRHYRFMAAEWTLLDGERGAPAGSGPGVAETLEKAVLAGDAAGYLIAFNAACEALPAERLLARFSR